ncbi:hypothetical protein ACFL59_08355 [Planctomycetota bacterium]
MTDASSEPQNDEPTPAGAPRSRLARLLRCPAFTPQWLLLHAGLLLVIFTILHLLGLREYTSFLSGTTPAGEVFDDRLALQGAAYLLTYLATVVLVPILVLGSGIQAALLMLTARLKSRSDRSATRQAGARRSERRSTSA